MTTRTTSAGAMALHTKRAGSRSNGTMSIFSPRSSWTTACTREPFMPTHAPTGSTSLSRLLTAILLRAPGSRAAATTRTMPSVDRLDRSSTAPGARVAWSRLTLVKLPLSSALVFGLLWLVAAVAWARRQKVAAWGWAGASAVGLSIAGAWWFTASVAATSMEAGLAPIQALSFTGPSAEVLSRVLFAPDRPPTFDFGLVPGVFLGAFVAAALFRELKLEGFSGGASMRRYLIGAVLMGFGGMTAGGCAVGAGLSGAAVFTVTSWVTLSAMWAAAALTDRLVDQRAADDASAPLGDQPVPRSRAFG